MNVPLLDTRRQNLPLEAELKDAFRRVLESGRYILGAEVEAFEAEAAALGGARQAVGMSSGTDAILVALMALEIGPGDEVICPAFTFFATAGCIARVGAKPVFADSCPLCFNLNPAGLESLITPRTRAVIPVHLFGQPADMGAVMAIARRHGLAVIEDAAQSFGSSPPAGDFATVSFFPSKNLGGLGDAGLLLTNDERLAQKARLLRNHGAHPKYYHSMVGGNFRLDELQAALLRVKLPHLPAYSEGRRRHAEAYRLALAFGKGVIAPSAGPGCTGSDPATGEAALILPAVHAGRTHIRNQFTVRAANRDVLKRALTDRGIASEIYYPVPLHRQECFQKYGPHAALPAAERLAEESLSLPVFPELSDAERQAVVEALLLFLESA